MKREELLKTVAKFVHGVNSRGGVLMPWKHEKGCGMCDGILEIVEAVLKEQQINHSCLGVLRQRIWVKTGHGTLKCVIVEGSTPEELREAVQRIIK